MKEIANTITTIKLTENNNVSYADLLMSCVNRPVKEGVDLKTMRRDLRIMGIIEDAILETKRQEKLPESKREVVLMNFEDEDFKVIAKLVEESQWVILHKDILTFADLIINLK